MDRINSQRGHERDDRAPRPRADRVTPYKIVIVEPDPDVVEILVSSLTRRFDAHITCVADAESCLDVDLLDPRDLLITELDLQSSNGLELAQRFMMLGPRPVILLADDATASDAIDAMRLGVRDMFLKPFPVTELLDCVERALCQFEVDRARAAKYRRMRKAARQVLRERRELNQRVELVCKDLVGAHRRLVTRVLDIEKTEARNRN